VHEIFIRRVGEFTVRAAKGDDIVDELHSMLTKWLINHIANEDRDYSKSVLRMLARQEQVEKQQEPDTPKERRGLIAGLLARFFR